MRCLIHNLFLHNVQTIFRLDVCWKVWKNSPPEVEIFQPPRRKKHKSEGETDSKITFVKDQIPAKHLYFSPLNNKLQMQRFGENVTQKIILCVTGL